MQPLKALNNVQKARLLHALLMHEIPAFLKYTQQLCTYMREKPDEVRTVWVNQLFGVDFWFGLAEEADRKIKRYGKQLEKSSAVFSDQLFDGYGALYLNHCLTTYTEQGKHTDPKFKTAVDLFLTLNLKAMQLLIIQHHPNLSAYLLVGAGVLVRYIINRRRFNRRGVVGLQLFSSYEKLWLTTRIEAVFYFFGLLAIVAGIFLFIFK